MKIRSALRAGLTALAVVPLAVVPSFAFAKPKAKAEEAAATAKKKSVALGRIAGKRTANVRGWVREVLESNFELTDAEDFAVKPDDESIAEMAKELGVEVVVVGKLQRGRLVLSVRDGATGRQLKEIVLRAPQGAKLEEAVKKKLPKQLFDALGVDSAEEAAKKDAEEAGAEEEGGSGESGSDAEAGGGEAQGSESSAAEEPSDQEKQSKSPAASEQTPLDLRVGIRFSKRDLTFKDTLNQRLPAASIRFPLRDYHAQLDLSVFLRAELYPGAILGGEGVAANFALAGGFEYGGIPSKTVYSPQGGGSRVTLTSNAQDWYFGGKLRAAVSPTFGVGFFVGYGQQSYILKGDENAPLVPDVTYRSIRFAADAHATYDKLFVDGQLGARLVTSAGELGNGLVWFDNVAGRALDLRLIVGFQATPLFAVFAGADVIRYGLDFNPLPSTATRIAGGAVDQFIGGSVGARLTLPGPPVAVAEQ